MARFSAATAWAPICCSKPLASSTTSLVVPSLETTSAASNGRIVPPCPCSDAELIAPVWRPVRCHRDGLALFRSNSG